MTLADAGKMIRATAHPCRPVKHAESAGVALASGAAAAEVITWHRPTAGLP
jgi:hypothetical protein